jgi:hypothetical protein
MGLAEGKYKSLLDVAMTDKILYFLYIQGLRKKTLTCRFLKIWYNIL